MTIVNKNNKITITLNKGVDMNSIQKFIDYLMIKEIASKSKATISDANNLIKEIKSKRKVILTVKQSEVETKSFKTL